MKKYYSLNSLINDIPKLKNNDIVYITREVALDGDRLDNIDFKIVRRSLKDKNIQLKILKEEKIKFF